MSSIALTQPVARGPEVISALNWRPVRLGDHVAIMDANASLLAGRLGEMTDKLLDLAALFSGQPRAVIDDIGDADAQRVMDSLGDHLSAYLAKSQK